MKKLQVLHTHESTVIKFHAGFLTPAPHTISPFIPAFSVAAFYPYLLSYPSPTLSPVLSFTFILKSWIYKETETYGNVNFGPLLQGKLMVVG